MMTADHSQSQKLYEELAELARANVSGPLGRKLVKKYQHNLVDSMHKRGLISEEDALDLKM